MDALRQLLRNNQHWATEIQTRDPAFFARLSRQQAPDYFWIGCSDSRVPANTIVDLPPGEVFVHRNVANMVKHADLNCLSAMQFAVDILQVKYIIVCGHYGCGGVRAALSRERLGICDNWLRPLQDLADKYRADLEVHQDEAARHARLCELNVIQQVANACQSTVVQDAWARGQELSVHGWIYGIHDGLLRDLEVSVINGQHKPGLLHPRDAARHFATGAC
ncbi:carbonate dehydratase [Cupriavidus numazuensis]|uniref:Carbonic anhydrase n=1 Tax=Cupriavidus numazuensis TaxID=221992 RepID=A0ABM8TFH8_9BURK|nr:carbonate dehydratase [Cupriavidus numazuensis]CAG2142828.1 Carbonic anhydrase 2 [Cupriavidus numazuensis]